MNFKTREALCFFLQGHACVSVIAISPHVWFLSRVYFLLCCLQMTLRTEMWSARVDSKYSTFIALYPLTFLLAIFKTLSTKYICLQRLSLYTNLFVEHVTGFLRVVPSQQWLAAVRVVSLPWQRRCSKSPYKTLAKYWALVINTSLQIQFNWINIYWAGVMY